MISITYLLKHHLTLSMSVVHCWLSKKHQENCWTVKL